MIGTNEKTIREEEKIVLPINLEQSILEFEKRTEKEFDTETSKMRFPNLNNCKKIYPNYFSDQLEDLMEEELQFFKLDDFVPSPLVWLYVNDPQKFSFACNMYSNIYKQLIVRLEENGINKKLPIKAQEEISHLKEEFESYFLNLDLNPMQKRIQEHISSLYEQSNYILNEKSKKEYINNVISPLITKYNWILDKKDIESNKLQIKNFYEVLFKLDNLLREKGLYDSEGF
ncbi:hypothetical protein J4404_02310 [Candidatus Woesearchaeota archaeon]|nr:hypothetical protein [Candidatus Woesearchaeota archaeon]